MFCSREAAAAVLYLMDFGVPTALGSRADTWWTQHAGTYAAAQVTLSQLSAGVTAV